MNESGNLIVFFFKEKITLKHLKTAGLLTQESAFKQNDILLAVKSSKYCILFSIFPFSRSLELQFLVGPFLRYYFYKTITRFRNSNLIKAFWN